jgi:hypothetical protein
MRRGPLGIEPRDIVLDAALSVVNFTILYWLLPDVLEGPDWVRRPNARPTIAASTASTGDDIEPPASRHGSRTPASLHRDICTDAEQRHATNQKGVHHE